MGEILYKMWEGSMGSVLPEQVARMTPRQLAMLCDKGKSGPRPTGRTFTSSADLNRHMAQKRAEWARAKDADQKTVRG